MSQVNFVHVRTAGGSEVTIAIRHIASIHWLSANGVQYAEIYLVTGGSWVITPESTEQLLSLFRGDSRS